MTEPDPDHRLDFRLRISNLFMVAVSIFLYVAGLRYAAVFLAFHYLDGGWTRGKYSPFSKIGAGLLRLSPSSKPKWRPAAPFIRRDRLGFGISLLLLIALLPLLAPASLPAWPAWPFNLLAYALLGLAAMDLRK